MNAPPNSIRKFNPGTGQSDQEVIRQFVARDKELEIVLDVLRSNIDADSCQNTLVVAPRGAGKTMLLARVAAELRANAEFSSHLLPVRFMEESHEAYDIGEFWLEAIFHLVLEIEATDPEVAHDLRRSRDDLCARWRPDLAAEALGTLLEASDRLGRHLVLFVENLQDLCHDSDRHFGWALRAVLQGEPRVMLVGSATTRFHEIRNASEPFFELFHFVDLKPLADAACLRLWRAVSDDKASERTVRPLEILTGGSPRMLVIVAEFARHRSLPRLMEGLVTLIDNHTEYFKGHLEQLPRFERRTYVALIDLWQPSSTGEIAQRARMDVRTVSTCIGRLRSRGLVTAHGAGRRKRYVAAERLYSIYYKLRRERDESTVVRNLIRFMAAFYTSAELMEMSDDLMQGASESASIYQGVVCALHDAPYFIGVFEYGAIAPIVAALGEGRHEEALQQCDRHLSNGNLAGTTTCKLLLIRAQCLADAGEDDAEVRVYYDLIGRFGDDDTLAVQHLVAAAYQNLGVGLRKLGDVDASIEATDHAIRHHSEHQSPGAEELLATALSNKASALVESQRFPALTDTLDEIVERFGGTENRTVRILVVFAAINKGTILDRTGDTAGAVATYRDALNRFGDCGIPEVQVSLASAQFNLAVGLRILGDFEAAIAAYESLERTFGERQDKEIQTWVARGLLNLGVLLNQDMDAARLAVQTYDRLISRFGRADTPAVRRQVAMALVNRGAAQRRDGDTEAAIASWSDVTSRFSSSGDEYSHDLVASAMVRKAGALAAAGSYIEAREVLDQILADFGENADPRISVFLGRALVGLCDIDLRTGHVREALAWSERLESEFALHDGEAFTWHARCASTSAYLALADLDRAQHEFKRAYHAFAPTVPAIRQLVHLVSAMLTARLPARTIIDILANDDAKAEDVTPLIVALRQHSGEDVRAAEEVAEVAADIRAFW